MIAIMVCLLCATITVNAAPLPLKVVDLTYVYDERSHKYPIFQDFNLKVVANETVDSLYWFQQEEFSSSTHMGTHMDAPSHFIPGGRNVDQLDVANFFGPTAVIDIRHKTALDAEAVAALGDFRHWEEVTGDSLNGTIVFVRTGWGQWYYNKTAYLGNSESDILTMRYPGIEAEAAQWLVDHRRVKAVGIDGLSLDVGSSHVFPTHKILLGSGIYGLENVAHLDKLPISGATVHVMPMKIARASGSPTRIVATFPQVIM